jgi:hypothetical protein
MASTIAAITVGKVGLRESEMLVIVYFALYICCQLMLASMGLRISEENREIDRHWPGLEAITNLCKLSL